jgi:large subunit ribosomal protein L25
MANRVQLKAQKRELFGHRVGRLRRAGILPATVYGHNVQPQSIQVDAHEAQLAMRQAGMTQLIDLTIEGETAARPVLIRQTGVDAKRNTLLHVEFFQANLREKITTHVPLHFVGESPADKEGGILLHVLDHVDIESLPQDVPEGGIEVDVSQLVEMNSQIVVGDLTAPPGITILTAADETVAKVNPPVSEEAVQEVLEEPTQLPEELGGEGEPQPDAVPEA